ncbi:hypothetical protein [Bradyrhizobium sp. 142]|uniref:hypothetical protein n=1 Tax=Bradyrhizobium sp. 142 TaxID=2782618 RepID=UPI001FF8D047|nr:hypothetical protein [Bradyrhizobium sp. 142]MCK1731435.1 hypothetical protein [Bradyrhizobium sp. 142]
MIKEDCVGRLHRGSGQRSFLELMAPLGAPFVAKATAARAKEELTANGEIAQKLVALLNRARNSARVGPGINLTGPSVNRLQHLPTNLVPLLSITEENSSQVVAWDGARLDAKRPDDEVNVDYLQERWLAWRAQ